MTKEEHILSLKHMRNEVSRSIHENKRVVAVLIRHMKSITREIEDLEGGRESKKSAIRKV